MNIPFPHTKSHPCPCEDYYSLMYALSGDNAVAIRSKVLQDIQVNGTEIKIRWQSPMAGFAHKNDDVLLYEIDWESIVPQDIILSKDNHAPAVAGVVEKSLYLLQKGLHQKGDDCPVRKVYINVLKARIEKLFPFERAVHELYKDVFLHDTEHVSIFKSSPLSEVACEHPNIVVEETDKCFIIKSAVLNPVIEQLCSLILYNNTGARDVSTSPIATFKDRGSSPIIFDK